MSENVIINVEGDEMRNAFFLCIILTLGLLLGGCSRIKEKGKKGKWVIKCGYTTGVEKKDINKKIEELVTVDFLDISMRSTCQFLSFRMGGVIIEVEVYENTYHAPLINICVEQIKIREFLDRIAKMTNTKWKVEQNHIKFYE